MKLKLALTAVLLCITAALAQGPPPHRMGMGGTPPDPATMIQMRVEHLTTMLGLTDAQKATATTIFTNAQSSSESLRTALDTNRQSLSAAIKKNDTASIDTLAIAAGTLHGQMLAIEAKAQASFYAILTPDQQAKFDSMPHGGPGMMGFGVGGGMRQMRHRPSPSQ